VPARFGPDGNFHFADAEARPFITNATEERFPSLGFACNASTRRLQKESTVAFFNREHRSRLETVRDPQSQGRTNRPLVETLAM